MCMPFPGSRGPVGGEPAMLQEACAGVAHAQRKSPRGYPVTIFARPARTGPPTAGGGYRKGALLADWLSTTDHKIIGHLYLITSFGFFIAAGIMAMIIRAQLFGPDNSIVSD